MIAVPEKISDEDYQAVISISELIDHDSVESKWRDFTITEEVNCSLREIIKEIDGVISMFSIVGTCEDELFGIDLKFKLMRVFRSARLKEPERIKKLVQYSEDGDKIKLTFIPGDDNTYMDTLRIPADRL